MRFGSTAKVLLKCKLKYYRISECGGSIGLASCSVRPAPLQCFAAICPTSQTALHDAVGASGAWLAF